MIDIGCRYRRGPYFTAYKPSLPVPLFGWRWSSDPDGWLFTFGCRALVVGVGWQKVRTAHGNLTS